MSGTSLDALDAALVDFSAAQPKLVSTQVTSWPGALKDELLALCSPGDNEILRLGEADHKLGILCAKACMDVIKKAGIKAEQVIAIGSHGQTIRHHPERDAPFTLQIGNPNLIAQRTGITTVADFRRRDLAAGGQGAPLAPGFHNAVFRSTTRNRAILNIGGMANLTLLPANPSEAATGFDTGPGNVLLDAWCERHLRKHYDENGQWASSGSVDTSLLQQLLSTPYFSSAPPKSTGRELFNIDWLDYQLRKHALKKEDVAATLLELTAYSINGHLRRYFPACQEVFVCGGGANNRALMERLKRLANNQIDIDTTQSLGIAPDWVEAAAFAWFAKRTLEHQPSNLTTVTGASDDCILGGVYYA